MSRFGGVARPVGTPQHIIDGIGKQVLKIQFKNTGAVPIWIGDETLAKTANVLAIASGPAPAIPARGIILYRDDTFTVAVQPNQVIYVATVSGTYLGGSEVYDWNAEVTWFVLEERKYVEALVR